MNTDLQEQLFKNIDDLEIIMAQGGAIPDAVLSD